MLKASLKSGPVVSGRKPARSPCPRRILRQLRVRRPASKCAAVAAGQGDKVGTLGTGNTPADRDEAGDPWSRPGGISSRAHFPFELFKIGESQVVPPPFTHHIYHTTLSLTLCFIILFSSCWPSNCLRRGRTLAVHSAREKPRESDI